VYPDAVYKTRTDAVPLFDQKPVIYLEGFNGYFDLHEIHPVGADGRALDRNGHGTGQERVNGAVAAAQSAANDDPSAATAPSARERVAVVFPGQGAQSKGMGKDLFAAYPEQTDKASEILGYSIRELCVDDPDNRLNQTQYTQPALYVVNALGLRQMQESGAVPADIDVLAGHSLGEYNALLAAGVFDFETGLRLVVERGRLMSQAAGGGMAAVVGLGADALRAALDEAGLQSVDLANFNTPSQIVISGPAADIEAALAALRKQLPGMRLLLTHGTATGRAEGEKLHAAIAEDIERNKVDLVFTAGPLMRALSEAIPAERRGAYAEDADTLAPLVAAAVAPGDVVVIKGSNGSRTGRIVAALKARFPAQVAEAEG